MTVDIRERVAEVLAGPEADTAEMDERTLVMYLNVRAKMYEHWLSVAETLLEEFNITPKEEVVVE